MMSPDSFRGFGEIKLEAPAGKVPEPAAVDVLPAIGPRQFIDHDDWSVSYTVRTRDSLAGIALDAYRHAFDADPNLAQLQETMTNIMAANNLRLLKVRPGQELYWDRTFSYC